MELHNRPVFSVQTWQQQHVVYKTVGLNVPGLKDLSTALRKVGVVGRKGSHTAPSSYTEAWTVRTLLIGRMRSNGVKRLKMAGHMSISHFQGMFPDECRWLTRFGWSHGQRATLAGLFNRLGYKQPPELLSMWLCLLCNHAFDAFSANQLEARKRALRAALMQYHDDHAMWPHPLVLVKLVLC